MHNTHGWQRISNHLFYETPPPTLLSPLFKVCTPHPCLQFSLPCFFGWICHHAKSYVLFCLIMNPNLLSCVSLVLAAPYCVFYVKRHQIYSRFVSSGKYFGQKPLFLPHPSKFWKPYFFPVFYFRKISSHHHCHHFHLNIKHFWRGIGWRVFEENLLIFAM